MWKHLAPIAALTLLTACSKEAPETAPVVDVAEPDTAPAAVADEDPHLWLEEVEGEEALAWVEEQNEVSLGYLESLPSFEPLFQRNLEIYNSDDRIPMLHLFEAFRCSDAGGVDLYYGTDTHWTAEGCAQPVD